MGRSLEYGHYLRLAVECQEKADDAERRCKEPYVIAAHQQQAARYRELAQAAAVEAKGGM